MICFNVRRIRAINERISEIYRSLKNELCCVLLCVVCVLLCQFGTMSEHYAVRDVFLVLAFAHECHQTGRSSSNSSNTLCQLIHILFTIAWLRVGCVVSHLERQTAKICIRRANLW